MDSRGSVVQWFCGSEEGVAVKALQGPGVLDVSMML